MSKATVKSQKKKQFDKGQKSNLRGYAKSMFTAFANGVISPADFHSHDLFESGGTFFAGHIILFTQEFVAARTDFVLLAAKMLKAKAAHENTIAKMCLKASQVYLSEGQSLEAAAEALTDRVLEEADREYVHIEPNFLVLPGDHDGMLQIGRVKSMRTAEVNAHTSLGTETRVALVEGAYPDTTFVDGTIGIGMPTMAWVVDVPSTKENVSEEAKWLIDVAISLLRFEYRRAPPHFPAIGKVEAHPTKPTDTRPPHVTIEGETTWAGGWEINNVYEIDQAIVDAIASERFFNMAATIFDPPNKSLALRVAQGLGWMTRGRQVADRAERLLAFFTALEALLSSDDKSAPIVQTISRFVSVIYTQDVEHRVAVFNHIKSLYATRSAVVHAGRREVLWSDVNTLQHYVEAVFSVVLNQCDLAMSQEKFATSLSNASHGGRWEFAHPEEMLEPAPTAEGAEQVPTDPKGEINPNA